MQEPIRVTDADLKAVLDGERPVLLLFSDGSGLRGDFSSAFNKAVGEHSAITFARINPQENTQAAEQFGVGDKPVMIGWYNGAEILRRSRPWGSDVPLAIDMLQGAFQEQNPEPVEEEDNMSDKSQGNGKPVIVTDQTFQEEVIDYSRDVPVLIDFWAEWCGPCRMVSPTLEKLAGEFAGQIRVAKVNVDENPGLSQTFQVMSIPNIMAIKNRTIVFNQPGALPEAAFRDLIAQLIKLEVPDPDLPEVESEAESEEMTAE